MIPVIFYFSLESVNKEEFLEILSVKLVLLVPYFLRMKNENIFNFN